MPFFLYSLILYSVFCSQILDDFIFAFFAVEMFIKMVAMGIWGKGTYLAETWNRLDCFIVVAGYFHHLYYRSASFPSIYGKLQSRGILFGSGEHEPFSHPDDPSFAAVESHQSDTK